MTSDSDCAMVQSVYRIINQYDKKQRINKIAFFFFCAIISCMTTEELRESLNEQYPHTSSFLSGFILFLVDILVIILSIGIGFFIVNLVRIEDINFKSFINYSVYIPFIMIIFVCEGLYPGIMIPPTEEVKKNYQSHILFFCRDKPYYFYSRFRRYFFAIYH